ncbi:MAG: HAD family phosphatase [Anaerolineales bacterium]
MIRAVLFDLGGVLVRTEDPQHREALAERYGMTYREISELVYQRESAVLATLGKITAEEHWQNIQEELGLSDAALEAFKDEFWGGDVLDDVLVDFIRGLGLHYTTALLSNAWDDLREVLTEVWGIADAFDRIFISAELGLAKPGDEIYQHVIQELGTHPGEMVFIDDFPENVQGARENGINAIHFRSREQALGELRELLDNPLYL